jgi:thiol:disulfide interchange protein DsbD
MRKFLTKFLALLAIPMLLCLPWQVHADQQLAPMFDLGQDALVQNAQTPFSGTLSFDQEKKELVLRVEVSQGAYVYLDSISANASSASLGRQQLPSGRAHKGPDGKERQIIDHSFEARFKVMEASSGASADVSYQGCDSAGVCYPPEELRSSIPAVSREASSGAQASEPDAGAAALEAQQNEEAGAIHGSFAITLLIMLLTGMGLDLTPCVLPLLGVFSAMIMGAGHRSLRTAFVLNLSYLIGLVAAYTALGWVFASAGMQARAVFASPAATIAMAAVFLIFAADCAGLISIKVPALFNNAIQKRLSSQRHGAAGSAFVFGALSGLLTTPCTSAPLAAALLYVAHDGSTLRGTLMFMAVGLGMGIPLAAAGIFGARILPKPGSYSVYVKKLIALPLMFAACLVLMPLVGWNRWAEAGAGALMMLYFVWITMGALHVPGKLHKAVVSILYAACTFFTVSIAATPAGTLPFEQIESVEELEKLAADSPLYVSFSASWCENCHALDEDVYSKDKFGALLDEKKLKGVRIDLSDTKSEFSREIVRRFGITGVPAAAIMESSRISPLMSGYHSFKGVRKFVEAEAGQN